MNDKYGEKRRESIFLVDASLSLFLLIANSFPSFLYSNALLRWPAKLIAVSSLSKLNSKVIV